jgi:hypothetical protein
MNDYRKGHKAKIFGILCIILGVVCNKFVIETMFSGDGKISALSVNIAIILLQIFFISAGVLYIKQSYNLLSKIGVGLMILFVLQFWIRVLLEVPFPEKRMFKTLPLPPSLFESGFHYRDQISRYEMRFDEVKRILPPTGVVGYVTSKNLPAEQAKFHYGLTTYALSPIRVERSTRHNLVVGNFPDSESVPLIHDIKGLVLIEDFGNGVALFKQKNVK